MISLDKENLPATDAGLEVLTDLVQSSVDILDAVAGDTLLFADADANVRFQQRAELIKQEAMRLTIDFKHYHERFISLVDQFEGLATDFQAALNGSDM